MQRTRTSLVGLLAGCMLAASVLPVGATTPLTEPEVPTEPLGTVTRPIEPEFPVAEPVPACPEPIPAAGFADVRASSTHGAAIACVSALGVTQGATATTFRPGAAVARGQMATFIARLLRASGEPVRAPGVGRFDDLDGSAHRAGIEALAALGIVSGRTATTFGPNDPVRRDQMASFLDRTITYLELPVPGGVASDPAGTDGAAVFGDVPDDNRHAASITRLAAAGLLQGLEPGVYGPAGTVTRAQMASLLTRTADLLATADRVHAPYVVREPVIPDSTVVLTSAERDAIVGFGDDSTIEFDEVPERIEVGVVLASAPSAAAPAGLLRRVVAIDGDTVRTAPAALTDAIHAGSAREVRRLTLDGVRDQQVASGVAVTAPSATRVRIDLGDGIRVADGVTASGSVTLDLGTEVVLDIARRRSTAPYVARLGMVTTTTQDARLRLEATKGATLRADVPLYRADFAPVVLRVGGVPVVVVPELEVVLGADGDVTASTGIAARQQATGTAGVRYTAAGGWAGVAGWSPTYSAVSEDLDTAFSARLGVTTSDRVALYGGATLAASVTPYIRGRARPTRDPAWTVHGGATIHARADADPALLPGVAGLDRTALRTERRLAVAPPPPPPPPPPEPDPVRIASGWFAAPGTGPVFGTAGTTYRYTVEITDGLRSQQDLGEFQRFVDRYLGDPERGWTSRGAIRMQRVDDPSRARIRVLLAKPATVDRLCGQVGLNTAGIYSCWTGRYAVINSFRWFGGVSHVKDLELYRGYLINHEVGHGLGFRHRNCPGTGRVAPVMMQLTKSSQGCIPNPYPYP